jgi:hypothetical protein
VRKNALIARKQGFWQGYLTCEKAEKGREISGRIGANGSAKKGQKRRELTVTDSRAPALTILM